MKIVFHALALMLAIAAPAAAQSGATDKASATPAVGDLRKVGDVHFPTTCDPAVQDDFDRGLALLHSFFYEEARRVFTAIAEQDPKCASAWWGVAATYYHPIWTAPSKEEFAAGQAAIRKARELSGGVNETERGFITALDAFYSGMDAPLTNLGKEAAAKVGMDAGTGPQSQSCHGPVSGDYKSCSVAYEKALERLVASQPKNTDAAAFYALQLVATAAPGDPSLAHQKKAAGILEGLYAQHPNHPGLAHYLIHSYDYPPLARDGLKAAEAYADIAPWVPHALHMPSHIFTRLGMWKENIESNLASADAARKYAAAHYDGATSFEEMHALDYLAYGYLQTAQDAKARSVLDRLRRVERSYPEDDFVVAYAAGAMPARYALERRQWKEAATLEPPLARLVKKFPFAQAHVAYARALGAARTGDLAAAKTEAARLDELAAGVTEPRFKFFRSLTEVQAMTARGWIAHAEKRNDDAVALLRRAAQMEDSLGKHPVSPGAIFPARELLAELLTEIGKPTEALAEFEASLKIYPARFNAVYGAARAAERAGKTDLAGRYYGELTALASERDAKRPELDRARAFRASK
jgi:tetratricopeptide (TPR) repeat protein